MDTGLVIACLCGYVINYKRKHIMINASGGTPTSLSNQNSALPATGPGFPTHNPAMHHQQFMGGNSSSSATSSTTTNTSTMNPTTVTPLQNIAGATIPAAPKFPDPTKNLVTASGDKVDENGNAGNPNRIKPKKKMNLKMILGSIVLLLIILGSSAGFYLSQQIQDVRQQAATPAECAPYNMFECPNVLNGECQWNPNAGNCSDAQCTAGIGSCEWSEGSCGGEAYCRNLNQQSCSNTSGCTWTPRACGGHPGFCVPRPTTPPPAVTPTPAPTSQPPQTGMCPDNSGPAVWCATFICTSDVNGDGQCTSDDGVAPQLGTGTNCITPTNGCGQVDIYREGPSGQNWGAFCGTTYHDMSNCGPGGGTPTPTPAPLQCNQTCTSSSQCTTGLQCLPTYDFSGSWNDASSSVTPCYNNGTPNMTGFAAFVRDGHVEQYAVCGGQIWHRPDATTSTWNDVTNNVSSVGSGTITSFSTYGTNGVYQQWLTRGGRIHYRPNLTSSWQDITSNVDGVGGTGNISAYTASTYSAAHGSITSAYLTRGERVWNHTSSDWSLWVDATSNLNGIGSGNISSFAFFVHPDNSIRHHFIRGGKLWIRVTNLTGTSSCRLPAYPNSGSCQPPTPTGGTPPAGTYSSACSPAAPNQTIGNLSYDLRVTGAQPANIGSVVFFIGFYGNQHSRALSDNFLGTPTWSTTCYDQGWCGYWLKQVNDPNPNQGGETIAWLWDGSSATVGSNNRTINQIATEIQRLKNLPVGNPDKLPANYRLAVHAEYRLPDGTRYQFAGNGTQLLNIVPNACSSPTTPTPTPAAPTPTPTPATPTPTPTPQLTCNSVCSPVSATNPVDQCTQVNNNWSCDPTSRRCRLTANPTSITCDAAPLVCNSDCNPNSRTDACTAANANWSCDDATSKCRLTTNPTSTSCQAAPGAVACNQTCTSTAQCVLTNANYVCDTTTSTCRLASNPTSTTCKPVPPQCNQACNSNAECKESNANHICDTATGTCRLETNPGNVSCQPPTATPTPAPGCNEACVTNADCSNTNHICATSEDGSLKCRLAQYPSSTTCTLPTTSTAQPTLPPALPQTGPADWMNWLKAGLITIGLGAALFFLL